MENFNSFGLDKNILENLSNLKLIKPTPIQIQAIKPALEGKDILGSANTGTGKTAAFGIPLIQKLNQNSSISGLILTPTRELAIQVSKHLNDLMGKNIKIKSTVIIGGDSIRKQLRELKQSPRLFIGTPGRINDHLSRGSLKLNTTELIVLDETDRMLDMGFSIQIEKIIKYLPKKRQTLLFSATLPKNIKKISEKYLHKPIRISVDQNKEILTSIKHQILNLDHSEKYIKLLEELDKRDGSIIIFMKTKHSSKRMALKLQKQNFSVNAIHGDLKQNQRDYILTKFRKKKFRILVATDIAARGLDISHIEHVINYDLPQKSEDYIHRIGRTARAGSKGCAICFVTSNDKKSWNAINRLINPEQSKIENKDHAISKKNKKTKFGKKKFKYHKKRPNLKNKSKNFSKSNSVKKKKLVN